MARPGFKGDFIPEDHDIQTLGDTVQRWLQAFAATFTGNLVGNVTGDVTGAVTGNVTGSASRRPGLTLAHGGGAVTIALSGFVLVGVVDAAFVLPLASVGAGVYFTFMTGVVSAGAGVTITRAGADTINAKTTSAGTTAITGATVLTNTPATDVVWDYMTLVSDGVSAWYSIGQTGIWA